MVVSVVAHVDIWCTGIGPESVAVVIGKPCSFPRDFVCFFGAHQYVDWPWSKKKSLALDRLEMLMHFFRAECKT